MGSLAFIIESMQIRIARKEDYSQIYRLVKAAFETAEVSDGKEQDFVLALRKGENYLPDLELVAEQEGELIGHIQFTRFPIVDGEDIRALLLAPLCVKQKARKKGVDGALIKEGFRRAKDKGYKAVFLVGNPRYYGRFGFRQAETFGFWNVSGIPNTFVLACELERGTLDGSRGEIRFPEA